MRTKILLVLLVLGLTLAAAAPVAAAPAASGHRWHQVRHGETLFSIGRLYNVDPWAIARANSIPNPHRIYAGQWVRIPPGPPYYKPWPSPCGSYHIVRHGETLYSIGRWYGVSPWRIAAVNGIYNMNRIWAGQRLRIPCH
jgi:LysM repeat protein